MDRRTELLEGSLAYVLEHGLIGLSLRPLAAALGTSDRMLIYHFGTKEALVAGVLARANQRLGDALTADEPDAPPATTPGDLVRHAWAGLQDAAGTTRLYLELCVLSLGEPERWRGAHEELRAPWIALLRTGLTEVATPADRVDALAVLILDTIDGLLLDRLVAGDPARVDAAAAAFAELLDGRLSGAPARPSG